MRATNARLLDADLIKAIQTTRLRIPFFSSLVPAGFASPATDHIEKVLDLNELCITNAEATYFVRAVGDSMNEDGLWEGDIMVVDRSIDTYEGRIIVAWVNGDLTVKRFHQPDKLVVLMPSNPKYTPIYVQPDDEFRVYGVVTFWIKKAPTKKIF